MFGFFLELVSPSSSSGISDLESVPRGIENNQMISSVASLPAPKRFHQEDPVSLSLDSPFVSEETKTKKRRFQVVDIQELLKMSEAEVIEMEVSNSSYNTNGKRAQFKKTLEFIALNDYKLFVEDEINFKNEFKKSYKSYKTTEKGLFILRYIIMFGSFNLLRIFGREPIEISDYFIPHYRFLIFSKPFDTFLRFILSCDHFKYSPEVLKFITDTIYLKHPDLPVFLKNILQLIGVIKFDSIKKFTFNPPETVEDFEEFTIEFGRLKSGLKGYEVLRSLVSEKSQLYANSRNKFVKFVYIKSVLFNDDIGLLAYLLSLDEEMLLYVGENCCQFGYKYFTTIMLEALNRNSLKCLEHLLENFPGLATATNGQFLMPLEAIMCHEFAYEIYALFDKYHFHVYRIMQVDGVSMHLLEAAFYYSNLTAFIYYTNQVGINTAKFMVKSMWTDKESILATILGHRHRFNIQFIKYIVELFGINLNDTYTYNSREGNAIIFMTRRIQQIRDAKEAVTLGIDINTPIYHISDRSGRKTHFSYWFGELDGSRVAL